MNYINLNGRLLERGKAGIPVDSRTFRYGQGLYETILVKNGQISLLNYHWERLISGLKLLHISHPKHFTINNFDTEIEKTVIKNGFSPLCRVRFTVFTGSGGIFDIDNDFYFVIDCFSIDNNITELNEAGLVVGFAEGISKSADILANAKTNNSLVYVQAARQAKENKWNDALVLNHYGRVAESTIANVFCISGGNIYTPPLSEGCIAGVMRHHLLETLPPKGFHITEQSLTKADIMAADEVFLTNAIRHIKWVGRIGDKTYGNDIIKSIYYKAFY